MPPVRPAFMLCVETSRKENAMGKYFLAWLLGVPATVLIVIYLIFR